MPLDRHTYVNILPTHYLLYYYVNTPVWLHTLHISTRYISVLITIYTYKGTGGELDGGRGQKSRWQVVGEEMMTTHTNFPKFFIFKISQNFHFWFRISISLKFSLYWILPFSECNLSRRTYKIESTPIESLYFHMYVLYKVVVLHLTMIIQPI